MLPLQKHQGPAFIQVQFFYVNKTDPTQWYQLYQETECRYHRMPHAIKISKARP
jgi:hypothetical protein